MSKTDKTRPYWVKATEEPMRTCVPVHRHTDGSGECTLPEDPAADHGAGFGFDRDRCYWAGSVQFGHSGEGSCGCPLCTSQFERRIERRRDRRVGRRVCREALAAFRAGGVDAC